MYNSLINLNVKSAIALNCTNVSFIMASISSYFAEYNLFLTAWIDSQRYKKCILFIINHSFNHSKQFIYVYMCL